MSLKKLQKATFALGCFWHSDAIYGCTPGVVRTRVGYSGGNFSHPSYENLGDHTEAVRVEFDPEETNYAELLKLFWENHDPTTQHKVQYQSAIFYHDSEQQQLAENTKKEKEKVIGAKVVTRIEKVSEFYNAEDYHQKYYLQTHHTALCRDLGIKSSDLISSTVAAKLNGYVVGRGSREAFDAECDALGLPDQSVSYIRQMIAKGKQYHC